MRSIFILSLDILLLISKNFYISSSFVLFLSFYPTVTICVFISLVFSIVVFSGILVIHIVFSLLFVLSFIGVLRRLYTLLFSFLCLW